MQVLCLLPGLLRNSLLQRQSLVSDGWESIDVHLSPPTLGETILKCILQDSSEELLRDEAFGGK